MDALYQSGTIGKLYRLWFELNRSNTVQIRTGCGTTKSTETGENVVQGMIGSGLLSTLNLSTGVEDFFSGSEDEVSYGEHRLEPLLFQDDIGRLSTSVHAAKAGNLKIEALMNLKQLQLNVDKSNYILLGKKDQVSKIQQLIQKNPILLNGIEMKEKLFEKYLGEYIHSEGLSKTVEFTVQKRYWLTVSSIMEIKTILNDYRIHIPGGINTGLMLWETSVIPMLLNNADTWNNVDKKAAKTLEDLQNMLVRYLFETPKTTASPSLCWDTGMLTMKYRILEMQINFIFHLATLDEESLGKETYETQKKYKFPGLISDLQALITKFGLPNIFDLKIIQSLSKNSFKSLVREAIHSECENELKNEINNKDKLKSGPMPKESFEKKSYINTLLPANARQIFKFRSKMFDAKYNYKSDRTYSEELWKCSSCQTCIKTQDHVLFCPSYAILRR